MNMYQKELKDKKTVKEVMENLERRLINSGYNSKQKSAIILAVDELATNAVSYTKDYALLEYIFTEKDFRLRVESKGDPFEWEKFTSDDYLEEINKNMQTNGRGIYLTNKLMDTFNYEFSHGKIIARAIYKKDKD